MENKDAFAVLYYSEKALDITISGSVFYKYFQDLMLESDGFDLDFCEEILMDQSRLCLVFLEKARLYLGIKDEDIPRLSELLEKLNTDVITRSIFKKAVMTLVDSMPLDDDTVDEELYYYEGLLAYCID